MSKFDRAVLVFMAGTGGRVARGIAGAVLIALAISGGGWFYLLVIPGVMMIATGLMNYCPAGLFMTGSGKSDDILAAVGKYDALGSSVHKH